MVVLRSTEAAAVELVDAIRTGDVSALRSARTPLHWAASSVDVDVAAVLIEAGADLEAPGASIAGGLPLDDTVGYGCWHVARLLVASGARVDQVRHAAALGLLARLDAPLVEVPPLTEVLGEAFWQACHGGQRGAARGSWSWART